MSTRENLFWAEDAWRERERERESGKERETGRGRDRGRGREREREGGRSRAREIESRGLRFWVWVALSAFRLRVLGEPTMFCSPNECPERAAPRHPYPSQPKYHAREILGLPSSQLQRGICPQVDSRPGTPWSPRQVTKGSHADVSLSSLSLTQRALRDESWGRALRAAPAQPT